MNNKTIGNSFEQELCGMLFEFGFWVHLLNANKAGQPADIIAARNNKAYLIDAKVCSDNTFPLSRVEENQDLAMELWKDCGNGLGWFALKIDSGIYMLSHYCIKAYSEKQSSLSAKEIVELGLPLERWAKKCK
jgi:Holliday junction resolvase